LFEVTAEINVLKTAEYHYTAEHHYSRMGALLMINEQRICELELTVSYFIYGN
jgi:hypothetical protein